MSPLATSGSTTIDEAVFLRGGSGMVDLVAIILVVLIASWYESLTNVDAFQIGPHKDPRAGVTGMYDFRSIRPLNPTSKATTLSMQKPPEIPQHEYSAMSKSERRKLADPGGRDRMINEPGYPSLGVMFNQVWFKLPKHGGDHDLPVEDNGKTPRTEENALALVDSIVDMPNRENIVWYTNGAYQGGTERGRNAVHLFDTVTNTIAVFEKQRDGSYLFLTTCRLTPRERDHLEKTNGNFVTEEVLNNQDSVSIFKPKGMGSKSNSPMPRNLNFTPINSFESDIMGITPEENSQNKTQSNKTQNDL